MSEQRKRLERALRGCAKEWKPQTTDPWPTIRERVSEQRTNEIKARAKQVDETGRAQAGPHGHQLVPDHLLGWALAALSLMILVAVMYVAAGPLHGPAQHGPPPSKQHTPEKGAGQNDGASRESGLSSLRTKVDQTKVADGARVKLDWVYADEKFVAVGLHAQRLEGAQTPEGSDSAVLEPALWDDSVGGESKLPPYVKITDASGQDFDTIGGGTMLGPQRTGADVTFDAPETLKVGKEHRLRLEVPLDTAAGGTPGEKPKAGPFIFDFEVPVRPAPTIDVNQNVDAKGITITLKRVVASPLLPQAVVCFKPPDDEHDWMPFLPYDERYEKGAGSAPQELGDGCWSLMMAAPVEGRSTVTVVKLVGMPKGPMDSSEGGTVTPKTIHGPWTFEFEAPAAP
jgi:hypothetical protein